VWSVGPGKPGLLEPMGVHQDHRGHRYGTAISVAAAAALQQLGVVVRARMHRELQCRRCRHLRVSRLPAPPAEAGHQPAFFGLIELSASSSIGGKVSGCRASM
jgi:hypothetical protein